MSEHRWIPESLLDGVNDFIEGLVAGVIAGVVERMTADQAADLEPASPPPPPTSPIPPPRSHTALPPLEPGPPRQRIEVKHTCWLCGRHGSRRFVKNGGGWRCTEVEACARRRADTPAAQRVPLVDAPAPTPPVDPPAPTLAPPPPGVTAKCQDCTRTWTHTGDVLDQLVEEHELKRSHVVTMFEGATS